MTLPIRLPIHPLTKAEHDSQRKALHDPTVVPLGKPSLWPGLLAIYGRNRSKK